MRLQYATKCDSAHKEKKSYQFEGNLEITKIKVDRVSV